MRLLGLLQYLEISSKEKNQITDIGKLIAPKRSPFDKIPETALSSDHSLILL